MLSQSSPHSFPKVVNTNTPPMPIKVPPSTGFLVNSFTSCLVKAGDVCVERVFKTQLKSIVLPFESIIE
jgi:hypothetical protein